MIFHFGAQFDYKGPKTFILSKNLASVLVDIEIIDKKLAEDLRIERVEEVAKPISPFSSSLPGLMPKHDRGWREIHHLSYPVSRLVNNHIPNSEGKMRYTRFQDLLQMVLRAGRNYVILKRDMKDVFKNVSVAPHQ